MKFSIKRLLAVVAVSCALSSVSHAVSVGEPAPDFELVDMEGVSHSLSDFRGKTVVLEWINLGCPYVKKHYKSGNMQGLQSEAADEDVVWLSICSSAVGKQGNLSPSEWKAAYDEQGMASTTVLIDEDGDVGRLYRARATPHMFVVDATGVLAYNGAIDSIRSASQDDIAQAQNYVKAALDSIAAGAPLEVAMSKPYGCSIKY